MYKCKILADKISHLTDARYFSARFVDIICFDPDAISENDLTKSVVHMNLMKEWVAGPEIFIRSSYKTRPEIETMLREVEPDGFLISFFEEPDFEVFNSCAVYKEIIVDADNWAKVSDLGAPYKGFVFDMRDSGLLADEKFTTQINNLADRYEVFLKNSRLSQLEEYFTQANPKAGIAFDGEAEIRTGIRSYDETDRFLDTLEL